MSITCTGDHRIHCDWDWKDVDSLKIGDKVSCAIDNNRKSEKLFIIDFTMCNGRIVLDKNIAYSMGLVQMGGHVGPNDLEFMSYDKEIVEWFNWFCKDYGLNRTKYMDDKIVRLEGKLSLDFYNSLGVIDNGSISDRVPECIFRSPVEVICNYIKGVFDSDGIFSEIKKCSLSLVSKSENFLKDLQQLLFYIGIPCSRSVSGSKCILTIDRSVMKKYCDMVGTREIVLKYLFAKNSEKFGYDYVKQDVSKVVVS